MLPQSTLMTWIRYRRTGAVLRQFPKALMLVPASRAAAESIRVQIVVHRSRFCPWLRSPCVHKSGVKRRVVQLDDSS